MNLLDAILAAKLGGSSVTPAAVVSATGNMNASQKNTVRNNLEVEHQKLLVTVTENDGVFSADKTRSQIITAYNSKYIIIVRYSATWFALHKYDNDRGSFEFVAVQDNHGIVDVMSFVVYDDDGDVWDYNVSRLEQMDTKVTDSSATQSIEPESRHCYNCTAAALTSLTVIDPPATGSWTIKFNSGSTPTTTTIPGTIHGLESFAAEANTHYEINVEDNYAVVGKWAIS